MDKNYANQSQTPQYGITGGRTSATVSSVSLFLPPTSTQYTLQLSLSIFKAL